MGNNRFKNKVILVTGSTRGIGRATAEAFAEEGAKVIINGSNSKELGKEVQQSIEFLGGFARFTPCDISNENAVKEMVEAIIAKYGRIDVLVNNAGIGKQSSLFDLTVEEFQHTLDVNLIGTFLCIKHAARYMVQQKSGAIVNVSSIRGLEMCARKDMIDYSASKAGVINLTKSLAKELSPHNININAVCPGVTRTDLVKSLSKEAQQKAIDGTILGRMAEPEEIAKPILFLASEDARNITGEVLVIDAGYNLTKL